jgi:hypothetical protein
MARDGFSVEQIVTNPKQAEVGIPAEGSVLIWFKALAAKSVSLYLIICIVFNLWIDRECASAYIAQCGASLTELRFTNGRFLAGGNGLLQDVGLAVFVSGLIPRLPQDSPNEPAPPAQCASLQESGEYQPAGEQRRFPLYLEILAGVFLCGLISWGDAVWMDRR